ncbi:MAG: hypothetical protein ABJN69_12020 [Hellea sp.]
MPKENQRDTLTEKELEERQNAHPFAVPFLWLGNQKVIDNFIWLPVIGMIVTSFLGIVYYQKHPAPWDVVPGSWAIIGFVSYSFIVLCAKPLTALLARPEDYYGEGGLPDPDVSTEHTIGDHHD